MASKNLTKFTCAIYIIDFLILVRIPLCLELKNYEIFTLSCDDFWKSISYSACQSSILKNLNLCKSQSEIHM